MDYQIVLSRAWRYRDPARGVQVLTPGVYRVPEDISDALARRAIGEDMAQSRLPRLVESIEPQAANPEKPARVVKRRQRKGPAPENKLLHVPENKQTLV